MFCPNFGLRFKESNQGFCTNCGNKLSTVSEAPQLKPIDNKNNSIKKIKINQFYMSHWFSEARFLCNCILMFFMSIPIVIIIIHIIMAENFLFALELVITFDTTFLIIFLLIFIGAKNGDFDRRSIVIEDNMQFLTLSSNLSLIPILNRKLDLSSIKSFQYESYEYVSKYNEFGGAEEISLRYIIKAILQNGESINLLTFDYIYDCNNILKLLNFILKSNSIYLSDLLDHPEFRDIFKKVSENRNKCKKFLIFNYAITFSLVLTGLLIALFIPIFF